MDGRSSLMAKHPTTQLADREIGFESLSAPRTMLDLFSGRWGWSKGFAARGWKCVGIDLREPDEVPENCIFSPGDVMDLDIDVLKNYDFICASSPCEEFSVWGMRMFHPNPPYPQTGVELFDYTRRICEASGTPYVIENVRAAEQFIGPALQHCGPYYLWGNAVPPLMPQGIRKQMDLGSSAYVKGLRGKELADYRRQFTDMWASYGSKQRKRATERVATIPLELANCVADYAERLLEP